MEHKQLSEELIYHGRVFDLVRSHVQLPDGREHAYDLVKHRGAVVILPVDNAGKIWFVQQYRIGAEHVLLELPAGVTEAEEAPEICARREVQEEIGMAAGRLEKLGEFYMFPGYSTEKLTAYLATDLRDSSLPMDEDEFIEPIGIPIQRVFEMVRAGEIQDGKTLATLLLAQDQLMRIAGTTTE